LREQWTVQSEIVRHCRVPATIRRRLAAIVVNQILDQVLPATRGRRTKVFTGCIKIAGPILCRAPDATATAVSRRLAHGVGKRLRRTFQSSAAS
jgi:hypothetical protein